MVELIQAISCGRIDEPESPFVDLDVFSTCEKLQKLLNTSPLARPAGCSRRVLQPKCACVWRGGSGGWGWKRRALTPWTVDLRTSRVVRVSTQDRGAIGADRQDLMSRFRDSVCAPTHRLGPPPSSARSSSSLTMAAQDYSRVFVSLGMFIIDEFQFHDENDRPTGRTLPAQESSKL